MAENQTELEMKPKRRWDPIVKLTHWGIMAAVITNALITEDGSGWHIWAGYGLFALLLLRLLWGLIGPRNARFTSFPPSLSRAADHLGDIKRGERTSHDSHNPLGTLMVYTIWACLSVIVATGIAMAGPPPADPSAVEADEEYSEAGSPQGEEEDEEGEEHEESEGEEILEEVHEIAANILYALIFLHLLGVLFETRRSGREILGAMLPGGNR